MKILWTALVASWLVIGGMVYLFFIKGSVAPASDGRTAIILSQGEKDFVLTEMRQFLEAVQLILAGVEDKDMKEVAQAAKVVGMAGTKNMPRSLMSKLPLGFKQMGMPTHKAFDELAAEASGLGDRDKVISSLVTLMNNCVACHSTYRLEVERK